MLERNEVGISVGVLVDKLNGFDTADDIAEFLRCEGIVGEAGHAQACVISRWALRESGETHITTSTSLKVWNGDPENIEAYTKDPRELHPLSKTVRQFILAFDTGGFPYLEFPFDEKEIV